MRGAFLLCAAFALSGCGLTPLYSGGGAGPVAQTLHSVEVAPIGSGRAGRRKRGVSGPYAVGIDFGTESGRALLLDVGSGQELATSAVRYPSAVIDRTLPSTGHTGGIMVVLGDASTRLVTQAVSPTTWWYAATPAGGDVLGADW